VPLLEDDEASPSSRRYPLADLELEPRPAVEPTCQLLNRASSDDDSSIRSHDCEGVTDRARADARKAAGARVVRPSVLPDRCHPGHFQSFYASQELLKRRTHNDPRTPRARVFFGRMWASMSCVRDLVC
jgi:hypothetical protein